ncbi:hypothetical protein LR48_Vigan05g069200 [Vigna angularis]|uniref:Uncharacterized protein n=1 Tax=Phaseolus angularis TaxID=3914 RepID=A0A0L9UK06_PHAAN|nr:hypothetical protein LR48_Vigan05g069200 [Vigna angularis]
MVFELVLLVLCTSCAEGFCLPLVVIGRMQSIHRGQVATVEIIIEMYDTPRGHRWTMDEFNNVVAWPEEQAQDSGARAAKAPTMDDDDDEFEDAKDEGEEEDSDDIMG